MLFLNKFPNHVFKNIYQVALEENGEKSQVQLGKLEATIKSLSAELLKVCFKNLMKH